MTFRAVTFDVDGTLTDARALHWPMLWRNLGRLRALRVGLRVREELRATPFPSGEALRAREAALVAERLDVEPGRARALLDAIFDESLVACLRARGPDRALADALRPLAEHGLKLAAVSDRRIQGKLEALGLGAFPWAAAISADDTGRLKPDPETILAASRALGVRADELAHVGDREDADGAAARAAGAAFFLVRGPRDLPGVVAQIVASCAERA